MSDCSQLFGMARAIQDLCIRNTELLVAEACQLPHLGKNRTEDPVWHVRLHV